MKITILNGAGEVTNIIESPDLEHAKTFFPNAREWIEGDSMPLLAQATDVTTAIALQAEAEAVAANPSFWQKNFPTIYAMFRPGA